MDDFEFSAPSFHDFGTQPGKEDVDESYFDPRRSSRYHKMVDGDYADDNSEDENPYAIIEPVAEEEELIETTPAKVDVEYKPAAPEVLLIDTAAGVEDVVVEQEEEEVVAQPAVEEGAVVDLDLDGEDVDSEVEENPGAAASPVVPPTPEAAAPQPPLQATKSWVQVVKAEPKQEEEAAPPAPPATASPTPVASPQEDDDCGALGEEATAVTCLDDMLETVVEEEDSNPVPSAAPCPRTAIPTAAAAGTPSYLKPTQSFRVRVESKKRKMMSPAPAAAVPRVPAALTTPVSPAFQSLKRTRSAPKFSTTTLEIQQIMAERAKVKAQTKAYHALYEKLQAGAGGAVKALPARSVKPLTMPLEPKLKTNDRCKGSAAAGEYKPLAQQVKEFQTKTPKRYHTGRKPSPASARRTTPRVTTPVPFSFATEDVAKRRPTPLSSAQLEEAELAAHPKFKAQPINHKVMDGVGDAGVPKLARKKLTKPQPFKLKSDGRHRRAVQEFASKTAKEAATADAHRRFKAQGVMPVATVPKPAPRPPTKPIEKALPTDVRAVTRAEFDAQREARAAEAAAAAEEAAARNKAAEATEVRTLRKKMSFRAAPFVAKPAPPVMKATKELTTPLTPHFSTDKRAARCKGHVHGCEDTL